ncbi:MAG TPA: manganese efflux pump, partial [Thermomicrobiales bacterium]|nr:manganese efflux pump [Thermomicrobiales bacterium]
AVSLGLGLVGLPRARWRRVGLTFACFEGLMPIVGLLVGQGLGTVVGEVATYVAAAILIALGGREIWEAVREEDDDDDELRERAAVLERPLLLTGLSVSLDELAVGFALGVLRVPLGPALIYIAVQAFALTFLGLSLGRRLGHRLGEWAELAAGVVLALLGLALLLSEATGSHFL